MNLINEASPHFHGKGSTQWIMGMVCLSLLPTLVASVFCTVSALRCSFWCASPRRS